MAVVSNTTRLAMQMEVGRTPKDRPAHRTVSVRNLDRNITDDQARRLVDIFQPMLAHPIVGAKLVRRRVFRVLEAETRAEHEVRKAAEANQAARLRGASPCTAYVGTPETFPVRTSFGLCQSGNDAAAGKAAAQEGSLPDLSALLTGTEWDSNPATRKVPKQDLSFMEKARQDNFGIPLAHLFRNPFASQMLADVIVEKPKKK